jgi:glycosyltransferase involved in cell wall biosynthesis
MSTGLPIVASRIPALSEIVGEAGILVPPASSHYLAEGIRVLIEDLHMREELGALGRARVETYFTWEKFLSNMLAVYREAAMTR